MRDVDVGEAGAAQLLEEADQPLPGGEAPEEVGGRAGVEAQGAEGEQVAGDAVDLAR